MKIAVSSEGRDASAKVDMRFGRARYFVVYDDETGTFSPVDNTINLHSAQGAGIQSASAVVNAGCGAIITGHCGPKAFAALSTAGVSVFTVDGGTVGEAVERHRQRSLRHLDAASVEGHWQGS